MLIRWKSKDKSSSNQSNQNTSSNSSSKREKKRKGREEAEQDWQNDNKSGRNQQSEQNDDRRRSLRRDDPRRHTLGGDMHTYGGQQMHQQQRAMDLEMSTRAQKSKRNQPTRGYTPVSQGPLFDDDPGIMSEVETASTGFRRGGKQRSSLPVVRTPSKTLERPLGLVFLQYRSETKRALLPNEITSIDTVRALFVRSFPRQLTMAYLEGPNVKIYIHDASKDMFYELEDVRSHLREIRDRSVLRLFESTEVAAPPQILPGGPGVPQPLPQANTAHWDQDQNYFSEPEFDSDFKHQHIHKSKVGKQAPYYVGASQTLPRGMYSSERNKVQIVGAPLKPLRTHNSRGSMEPLFPYTPDQLYSLPDGYTSSPERSTRGNYEEPYYSQYGTRGPVVAPVIDEEQPSELNMVEDQYALYGIKVGPGRMPRTNQIYDPTRPEDLHRIRVEHMERQLANLTGLVQKALVNQNPQIAPIPVPTLDPNYLVVPHTSQMQTNGSGDDLYVREKPPKLGKNACQKSVSFEKSVSFSDDIQGVQKPHIPQHPVDSKPTKPAIKSSTLPRTSSSQGKHSVNTLDRTAPKTHFTIPERENNRLKPSPPPKPIVLAQGHPTYRADITLAPEVYNHLRGLQKKAKDLRIEVRTLRRLSQAQSVAVREDIKGAFMRIRATLMANSGSIWNNQGDQDATRITREEELYKQEVIRLEKDLSDLEGSVESLRGEVINRRTRVNMTAVEDMALVLSRASKTVAELKMKFPALSNGLRCILSNEMEKVVREEKFLKDEPDRLESALRRCKKLTGTLVTLKRLASVQEQRLPPHDAQSHEDNTTTTARSAESAATDKPIAAARMGTFAVGGGTTQPPPENALDALLDELKTFARPLTQNNEKRPDDSTSDESAQAIQSTVTTQISQARLYTHNDTNNMQPNEQQQLEQQLQMQTNLLADNGTTFIQSRINNNSSTLLVHSNAGSLRRLHSYPSGSDTDVSPTPQQRNSVHNSKPPVPERSTELITKVGGGGVGTGNKRIPPPPPPRTSSRSPLASPTSPNVPQPLPTLNEQRDSCGNADASSGDNSSGNESGNDNVQRKVALEMRHQELLKKQKVLQEQYLRLQQMSKLPTTADAAHPIMKTGSESNIHHKMAMQFAAVNNSANTGNGLDDCKPRLDNGISNNVATSAGGGGGGVFGSGQQHDNATHQQQQSNATNANSNQNIGSATGNNTTTNTATTTKQVYETEIL